MYRNLFIILTLALGFSILLYLQPWKSNNDHIPRIFDRLPDAQLIGQSDVLALSKSFSKMLFYYKIPFRDFLSPNFLLSQGKNYGVDLQAPVYFFANEKNDKISDWGAMLTLRDSSRVKDGLTRLSGLIELDKIIVAGQNVYKNSASGIYMSYGEDWMFVYQGDSLFKTFSSVLGAKRNEISPKWRQFINKGNLLQDYLIAQVQSDRIHDYGIESATVSLSNDSSSLLFKTHFKQFDSLSFQLKPTGPHYETQEFTNRAINLHVDISRLRNRPQDPLYLVAKDLGKKIGFPVNDMFDAWEGDVSFRQGGIQIIKENYIESELDENFNISEVVKYRDVKISGFSLFLSLNEKGKTFLNQLLNKGILTRNHGKYRLLYSAPINLNVSDSSMVLHTGKYLPAMIQKNTNEVLWTFNYTPVRFYLDSTGVKSLYGRVNLPLNKFVKDYFLNN